MQKQVKKHRGIIRNDINEDNIKNKRKQSSNCHKILNKVHNNVDANIAVVMRYAILLEKSKEEQRKNLEKSNQIEEMFNKESVSTDVLIILLNSLNYNHVKESEKLNQHTKEMRKSLNKKACAQNQRVKSSTMK